MGDSTTVFPGPSAAESDFSALSRDLDEIWKSLIELSLEGIMQSKQLWALDDLPHSLQGSKLD